MFVTWGERLYGKVDQVPGLFYVATKFFYLQYVPLVPSASILIIDGSETDEGEYQGKPISLSGKSILTAWLRFALFCGGVALVGIGLVRAFSNRRPDLPMGLGLVASGLCLLGGFWYSYRWTHAGVKRALELAAEMGIPPEMVAKAFVDNGKVPGDDLKRDE